MWDYYEHKICTCYLSAMINADESGLEDDEIELLNAWEKEAIKKVEGVESFHWDFDEESYFGKDEVTGLMADVVVARLMFKEKPLEVGETVEEFASEAGFGALVL